MQEEKNDAHTTATDHVIDAIYHNYVRVAGFVRVVVWYERSGEVGVKEETAEEGRNVFGSSVKCLGSLHTAANQPRGSSSHKMILKCFSRFSSTGSKQTGPTRNSKKSQVFH